MNKTKTSCGSCQYYFNGKCINPLSCNASVNDIKSCDDKINKADVYEAIIEGINRRIDELIEELENLVAIKYGFEIEE